MKLIIIAVGALIAATAAGAAGWKLLAPSPAADPVATGAEGETAAHGDAAHAAGGHTDLAHGAETPVAAGLGPVDGGHADPTGHHSPTPTADDPHAPGGDHDHPPEHDDPQESPKKSAKTREPPQRRNAGDWRTSSDWDDESSRTRQMRKDVEFREMARILSAMNSVEAARFMAHLDDKRALEILRSMPIRDAALILKLFPRHRAKALKAQLLDFQEEKK